MDAHFSKGAHGRSFLDGRSWTLILVRTLMDAHGRSWTLMDAHGRSFLDGRSWTIMDAWTLMDDSRTIFGRWSDAGRTQVGRSWTIKDVRKILSREGHATVTGRSLFEDFIKIVKNSYFFTIFRPKTLQNF